MPASIATSGSQTATLNTDHTLVTQTAPTGGAIYQLRARLNELVSGEQLTLRLQVDGESGGTLEDLYSGTFAHVQGEPYKDSPAVVVPAGARVRAILRQEGGTGRAFTWWLYRLDG
ncbi:hypothetical protein [Gemmatimonas sp.]